MIRVLIAEDQAMVAGALAALLDIEHDIEVVATASNGREALDAVRKLRPDVLLTDIEMPEMTGLELAAAVRADGPAPRVVILTTFARPGYLRRALDAGASGTCSRTRPRVGWLMRSDACMAADDRSIPNSPLKRGATAIR